MAKITKGLVDGLEPEPKAYCRWDSELRGFGVRVQPSGVMTYMLKYRTGAGRQRVSARWRPTTLGTSCRWYRWAMW